MVRKCYIYPILTFLFYFNNSVVSVAVSPHQSPPELSLAHAKVEQAKEVKDEFTGSTEALIIGETR